MNDTLEALRSWGCDIDGAMKRFMNDKEFYETMLHAVTSEPAFAALSTALAAGDVSSAFDGAHTLKGMLGNMGLTPMYNIACDLLIPLRRGVLDGTDESYNALCESLEKYKSIIGEQ